MNKENKSVSVAMAAYNGEAYIEEQIASILLQLKETDELIVSLDPSSDWTKELLRKIRKKDVRVRLVRGKGKGVIKNFENAIRYCKNDIIFLSDQDDVWKSDKVEKVLECFENEKTMVVMHDAEIVNQIKECSHPSFMTYRGCRTGIFKNIAKNSYIGCCMAFRKELKPYILPFPKNIPMHDQWIGLVGEIVGMNVMMDSTLIYYRRHDHNVSSDHHANVRQMLLWRINLVIYLIKFYAAYRFGKERNSK